MLSVVEQFTQMAKANTERGLRCATISYEGTERLVKLQTDAAVSAFEEGAKNIKVMLRGEGDYSKAFSEWPNVCGNNVQRMLDISRSTLVQNSL